MKRTLSQKDEVELNNCSIQKLVKNIRAMKHSCFFHCIEIVSKQEYNYEAQHRISNWEGADDYSVSSF